MRGRGKQDSGVGTIIQEDRQVPEKEFEKKE
jgi:hypothetical protein